jgi:hypothetical protein
MKSDEYYIIDLCDKVLGLRATRQHRFPFLLGDRGKTGRCTKLPVDAYYHEHQLVIEYRERQHSEPVQIMDRKPTISGCFRGEQRRLYDERRRQILPEHGLTLVELDYSLFLHDKRKCLIRRESDEDVVRSKLARVLDLARLRWDNSVSPKPNRSAVKRGASMENHKLKIQANDSVVYVVYRPNGAPPDEITGAQGAQLQEGSLVILNGGGVVSVIYGPGQWVCVNAKPV